MRKISPLIAFAIVALVAISIVSAAVLYEITIGGQVVVVETPTGSKDEAKAYQDAACTTLLTYIDWGEMQAGGIKTKIFYLKNTGDHAFSSIKVGVSYSGYKTYGELKPSGILAIEATLTLPTNMTAGTHPIHVVVWCNG